MKTKLNINLTGYYYNKHECITILHSFYKGKTVKESFEKYLLRGGTFCQPLPLKLIHDKNNQYDKNAVMVVYEHNGKNLKLGWIPKDNDINEDICVTMTLGGIDSIKLNTIKYFSNRTKENKNGFEVSIDIWFNE